MKGRRIALAAYFLQQPGAAVKLIRFRRDMRRVRTTIAHIAEVLVRSMPGQADDLSAGVLPGT